MEKSIKTNNLFQTPMYQTKGLSFSSYKDCLAQSDIEVTLDVAAIQSFLSFGYVCGDRTLIKEIKRQPWLSTLKEDKFQLDEIPKHGFFTDSYDNLADLFFNSLVDEAFEATKDFENIYVLLSGGLDSRIIAGILKQLFDQGKLKSKPIAVTWGLENSRDVQYAKKLAEILDFEIIHITIDPEIVMKNINFTAKQLGLIHSPEMLHNMTWFKNLPKNSIVLAGSFGDSIGRADFGGLHLLQLDTPDPNDNYNILKTTFATDAKQNVKNDITKLFQRSPKAQPYMHNEHFMQAYRMRGGLCHALSAINGNAEIYQMFTSPKVYSFIWSLHPSMRGDDIYIHLLKNHLPVLANFPWARTNKALKGKTIGAIKGLKYHYHEYTKWSKNYLKNDLEKLIDIDWFENFGIFNIESIISLRNLVRKSEARVGRVNDVWLWLAGFRVFVEDLEKSGKKLIIPESDSCIEALPNKKKLNLLTISKNYILNKSVLINKITKIIRTVYRKKQLKNIKKKYQVMFPPIRITDEK
jgi:hypothetical protein